MDPKPAAVEAGQQVEQMAKAKQCEAAVGFVSARGVAEAAALDSELAAAMVRAQVLAMAQELAPESLPGQGYASVVVLLREARAQVQLALEAESESVETRLQEARRIDSGEPE